MKNFSSLVVSILMIVLVFSCKQSSSQKNESKSFSHSQDSCNDPDANIDCSFTNMPENLTSTMVIAKDNEPGEKLVINGRILKEDSKTPYSGVTIYAYQTDANGLYSKSGNETGVQKWHGRLHGWCKTNENGSYTIESIRPAPYPDNTMPAHIHAVIKKPDGSEPFYISDFVFNDDPLVTDRYIASIERLPGGTGVVDLKKEDNVWKGKRDIVISHKD